MTLDDIAEAEELLRKVASWSDEEIKELPQFYQDAAERYRELLNHGDTEST